MTVCRVVVSTLAPVLALLPAAARAAGPMDRLKGVGAHAKRAASGGPDHLGVGLAFCAVAALVVGGAAWWGLRRKKT